MKGNLNKYYILFVAIIIGFAITLQLKGNYTFQGIVTIPKILEMQNVVENMKKENEDLEAATNQVISKLNNYKVENKSNNIDKLLEAEVIKVRDIADYEDVTGPGIVIIMQDSTNQVEDGQSLESLLIHDIDIIDIVNELRIAGAEAIAINDERVTANSSIRCGGPTINVDGKKHTPPFIIKAIGNSKTLEAMTLSPEGIIELMRLYGIRIDVAKTENILIKAFDGNYKLTYQKKAGGVKTQ